jgi:hypothetical protein
VTVADFATATDSAHTGAGGGTRAYTGVAEGTGTAHDAEAQLTGEATIEAHAEVAPRVELRISAFGLPVTHEVIVRYSDLQPGPDGPCVVEVVLMSSGEVIISGVGLTAGDAVAHLFEYMLPPSSSEYIDPNGPRDDGA